MNNEALITSFADFANTHQIDRPTIIRILEDTFKAMIRKKFGFDDNFNVIINLEKGDLQIWQIRQIVEDHEKKIENHDKITLTEAQKIEPDFEVGEEVAEEIPLLSFGRRAVTVAKQTLVQKIKDLEKDILYQKYTKLIGQIVTVEVHQILFRDIILVDNDQNELLLPKNEIIPKDRFIKGEYIKAIVQSVALTNTRLRIILSRTSPLFLEKLFEKEVPEIEDGAIIIKKVVRDPGERAKITVESIDDRIDPVGACVGMKGSRIHGIVKELQNENIDVIHFTDNFNLYIARALSPAKISSLKQTGDRITVYLKPDQVSLAIGKNGQNIRLASQLIGQEIDVYRELSEGEEEDINIEEFSDEIDSWIIEELKRTGFDTAKSILAISKDDFSKKIDLEEETIENIYRILSQEFE